MPTRQPPNVSPVDLLLDALTIAQRLHLAIPSAGVSADIALAGSVLQAHAALAHAVLAATGGRGVNAGRTIEPGRDDESGGQ